MSPRTDTVKINREGDCYNKTALTQIQLTLHIFSIQNSQFEATLFKPAYEILTRSLRTAYGFATTRCRRHLKMLMKTYHAHFQGSQLQTPPFKPTYDCSKKMPAYSIQLSGFSVIRFINKWSGCHNYWLLYSILFLFITVLDFYGLPG